MSLLTLRKAQELTEAVSAVLKDHCYAFSRVHSDIADARDINEVALAVIKARNEADGLQETCRRFSDIEDCLRKCVDEISSRASPHTAGNSLHDLERREEALRLRELAWRKEVQESQEAAATVNAEIIKMESANLKRMTIIEGFEKRLRQREAVVQLREETGCERELAHSHRDTPPSTVLAVWQATSEGAVEPTTPKKTPRGHTATESLTSTPRRSARVLTDHSRDDVTGRQHICDNGTDEDVADVCDCSVARDDEELAEARCVSANVEPEQNAIARARAACAVTGVCDGPAVRDECLVGDNVTDMCDGAPVPGDDVAGCDDDEVCVVRDDELSAVRGDEIGVVCDEVCVVRDDEVSAVRGDEVGVVCDDVCVVRDDEVSAVRGDEVGVVCDDVCVVRDEVSSARGDEVGVVCDGCESLPTTSGALHAVSPGGADKMREGNATTPVDDVTPPVDDVTPVDDATPPVDAFAPPVDDVTPPVDDVTPPVDDVTPPVDDVAPPVDDVTPPVDDVTPAVDDVTPPVDDVTPPVDDVTPPVDDVTPPVDDVTPAVDDVTPPVDDVTPVVDDVTPPVDDVTPPVDDVTPAVDDVTPPVDDVTPVVDDVTPPVDDVTPPVDDVTPPVDAVTPPVDDVTPAVDDAIARKVKRALAKLAETEAFAKGPASRSRTRGGQPPTPPGRTRPSARAHRQGSSASGSGRSFAAGGTDTRRSRPAGGGSGDSRKRSRAKNGPPARTAPAAVAGKRKRHGDDEQDLPSKKMPRKHLCGKCRQPGHNERTCKAKPCAVKQ